MLRNRLCRYRKREKLIQEAAEVESVIDTSGTETIENRDDDDEQYKLVQGSSPRSSGAITPLVVKLPMKKCPGKAAFVKKTNKWSLARATTPNRQIARSAVSTPMTMPLWKLHQ